MSEPIGWLDTFRLEHRVKGKGPLSVMLHITRVAQDEGLPLDPESLIAESRGQVRGQGKASVQAVLASHGIIRTLASEGGRTSRGSVGLMRKYVRLLNQQVERGGLDLADVEQYWVEQVKAYFASKPFRLRLDASKSLRSVIQDVLDQAEKREQESPGFRFVGAVMQHLVGAKLEVALPQLQITHHGASVADDVSGRAGDFVLNDVAIHVTTFPQQRLIEKCRDNLEAGMRPLIVTQGERLALAGGLAEAEGIEDRIEVHDILQFLTLNLHELSAFRAANQLPTVQDFVKAYNRIITDCETDPGLKIRVG